MTWTFHLEATEERKLLSRILQVLDSQMVTIHSFTGEVHNARVCVTFAVSSEQDKAYRIEALLHRLKDILSVSVYSPIGVPHISQPEISSSVP